MINNQLQNWAVVGPAFVFYCKVISNYFSEQSELVKHATSPQTILFHFAMLSIKISFNHVYVNNTQIL